MQTSGKDKDHKERHRRADMTQPPPPPAWAAARREREVVERPARVYPQPCALDGHELQIVERTRRDAETGQLWDFAVMLEIKEEGADGGWATIVRVDTAHDHVHVDRYTPSGTTWKDDSCMPAECREDLDQALRWARDHVWDVDARLGEWA